MSVYYNEIDPFCCEWLRQLIKRGLLPDGEIDNRSIEDVRPDDLNGFTQCHFFTGIGGWPYALRLAGWPDDRPIWTGSCPCQSWSTAGKRLGVNDERHLWPEFYRLIKQCWPAIIIGEQVSSSTVVGKAKNMSSLQTNEALHGILCELQRATHFSVQRLLERTTAATSENASRAGSTSIQTVAKRKSWRSALNCGALSRKTSGYSLYNNKGCCAGNNRQRCLPVDRATVQSGNASCVERSVFGSNCSRARLYTGECSCCPIRCECNVEHLGSTDYYKNSRRFTRTAQRKMQRLIAEIGREVENADCPTWLDIVQADLGRAGYTTGVCSSAAAGFGAPHIRQRLYWMAQSQSYGWGGRHHGDTPRVRGEIQTAGRGSTGELAHSMQQGLSGRSIIGRDDAESKNECAGAASMFVRLGDAESDRMEDRPEGRGVVAETAGAGLYGLDSSGQVSVGPMPTNGFWANPDWIWCRDKKWRPSISTFPLLVDGIPCSLGYDCTADKAKAGIIHALLPLLREIIEAQAVYEWASGRFDALQKQEILQPNLYGTCNGKGCVPLCSPQPSESSSANGKLLRYMWGGREVTCASFERKPYRQFPLEFDDLVCFLPPEGPFTQFFGCQWTAKALQILWEACCEKWPVLHTLGTFAPLWASFGEKDKNRLRLAISHGSWRAVQTTPTRNVGAFERQRNYRQRLQGYGNAIVIPQAVEFIKTVMEIKGVMPHGNQSGA